MANDSSQRILALEKRIAAVEGGVDKLPIPGAKLFLKSLSLIRKADSQTTLASIMQGMATIEQKIDNSFNVTLAAIDYAILRDNVTHVCSAVSEIEHCLAQREHIATDEYHRRVINSLAQLSSLVSNQIRNGEQALDDFARARAYDTGPLSEYVGKFLAVIRFVDESAARAQFAFNLILKQNEGLKESVTDSDLNIGSEISDYSERCMNEFDTFIKTTVPARYPSWCRGVFSGEDLVIYNQKYGDRFLSGGYEGSQIQCNASTWGSWVTTTIDILYRNADEKDEPANQPALWTLRSAQGGERKRWRGEYSKATYDRIYLTNEPYYLASAVKDPYRFSLSCQSETLIIHQPARPGHSFYAQKNPALILDTKATEKAKTDTSAHWTLKTLQTTNK